MSELYYLLEEYWLYGIGLATVVGIVAINIRHKNER